jgi:hypothetical protein
MYSANTTPMALKQKLKNSFYGLLGNLRSTPSDTVLDHGTEDIRDSMLASLGEGASAHSPAIVRRIRYATDIESLWYLRGDLMAALAAIHGERIAREKLASITAQFRGLLPGGMSSRPSPLVG